MIEKVSCQASVPTQSDFDAVVGHVYPTGALTIFELEDEDPITTIKEDPLVEYRVPASNNYW